MHNKPGVAQSMTRLPVLHGCEQARTVTELVHLTGMHSETLRRLLRELASSRTNPRAKGNVGRTRTN
jgi:DNA-binding IclR family transcriptional regulator